MKTKFNFNSQICTTREQSERLLALGLKKETADCYLFEYDKKSTKLLLIRGQTLLQMRNIIHNIKMLASPLGRLEDYLKL